jgi:patatin-like phospholipase/acyl hydrolase
MKNILSLDGGGVRTYFPLRILNEIENRTDKSISDLFDYMTGVSAGSLITSLLLVKDVNGAQKYTTSHIINIFTKECRNIFYYTYLGRCKNLWGLIGPKYTNENFSKVLLEYFRDGEKEMTLSSLRKPNCIITYDINYSKPYFFNSLENPDITVRDCILASTAAPTYFYPYSFELNKDPNRHLFVDGGVVTNNPSEICFLKALEQYGSEGIGQEHFMTLSLGTGYNPNTSNITNSYFGLYSWSYNILDIIFSANSNSQSSELSILNKILLRENNKNKFHRINIPIKDYIYLDDIYKFDLMCKIMDDWILKNELEINRLCEKLLYNINHKNYFIVSNSLSNLNHREQDINQQ